MNAHYYQRALLQASHNGSTIQMPVISTVQGITRRLLIVILHQPPDRKQNLFEETVQDN